MNGISEQEVIAIVRNGGHVPKHFHDCKFSSKKSFLRKLSHAKFDFVREQFGKYGEDIFHRKSGHFINRWSWFLNEDEKKILVEITGHRPDGELKAEAHERQLKREEKRRIEHERWLAKHVMIEKQRKYLAECRERARMRNLRMGRVFNKVDRSDRRQHKDDLTVAKMEKAIDTIKPIRVSEIGMHIHGYYTSYTSDCGFSTLETYECELIVRNGVVTSLRSKNIIPDLGYNGWRVLDLELEDGMDCIKTFDDNRWSRLAFISYNFCRYEISRRKRYYDEDVSKKIFIDIKKKVREEDISTIRQSICERAKRISELSHIVKRLGESNFCVKQLRREIVMPIYELSMNALRRDDGIMWRLKKEYEWMLENERLKLSMNTKKEGGTTKHNAQQLRALGFVA